MPYSFTDYKIQIRFFFQKSIPKGTKILDVGPGAGTYWKLLGDLGYKMDCLEIYEPYIEMFNLMKKYDNVYLGSIVDFDISKYDCIILGNKNMIIKKCEFRFTRFFFKYLDNIRHHFSLIKKNVFLVSKSI